MPEIGVSIDTGFDRLLDVLRAGNERPSSSSLSSDFSLPAAGSVFAHAPGALGGNRSVRRFGRARLASAAVASYTDSREAREGMKKRVEGGE